MVCFLACFGYSKKRKRPKSGTRNLSEDQGRGKYEPLDSNVIIKLDIRENPISSETESRSNVAPKETPSSRIKKKVSFNLNVKAYEPLPKDETDAYFAKENEEETAKSRTELYPSSYRYHNCRDSYEYDEEDDIKIEESDLEDDEFDEEDCEDEINQVEFSEQINSSSMEIDKSIAFARNSMDEEKKRFESNRSARDRSRYVHPVLNPVENITQWKAIKGPPPLKQQRKENVIDIKQEHRGLPFNCKANLSNNSKPLMQEIAVDASLTNWLVASKTKAITQSSNNMVAVMTT